MANISHMAKLEVWDDGRSGPVGCAAGNVALAWLGNSARPIRKLKGTVFESRHELLIGRICSTDSYLSEPLLHWANASWDQHTEMAREAGAAGKELAYLFVTSTREPASVHTWHVPAAIVESAFVNRQRDHRGRTCAIHIVASQNRHLLGGTDVSGLHATANLSKSDVARLNEAYAAAQASAGSDPQPVSRFHTAPERASTGNAYDIPVSRSRSVRIHLPGPLLATDITRLKQWVDLAADVLMEGSEQTEEIRQSRWLQEQVQTGLDELARGDAVDGEKAFARILSRSRARAGSR